MKTAYQEKCDNGHLQHYAVVYRVADAGNNGSPTVRFFIDHEECETLTLPAPMVDFPACFNDSMAFAVGNNLNDHPMQGWFDEVRYTARALAPAEFLKLRRPHKGLGFVSVGKRKRYYEDNQEDAWLMVCEHMPEVDPDFQEEPWPAAEAHE